MNPKDDTRRKSERVTAYVFISIIFVIIACLISYQSSVNMNKCNVDTGSTNLYDGDIYDCMIESNMKGWCVA